MSLRHSLRTVIFEAETRGGKVFDIALLWTIVLSVGVVILDSVPAVSAAIGPELLVVELVLTAIFAVEYALRVYAIQHPWRYVFSFYGLVDLLAIAPFLITLIGDATGSLLIVRAIRLLRIFRVFKLGRYVAAGRTLRIALEASRPKITVFLGGVSVIVLVMGTVMHLVEGPDNGFSSIPAGVYWAVVTMTTVGYGDMVPHTLLGKTLAGCLMITGYGVIAVPTGIVSVELAQASQLNTLTCPGCAKEGHDHRAVYCDRCGFPLDEPEPSGQGAR